MLRQAANILFSYQVSFLQDKRQISLFASFKIRWTNRLIHIHVIESGQVYAAGMNDFGQLGLGPDAARIQKNIEPREIHQLRDYAKQIACGLVHSQILLCK